MSIQDNTESEILIDFPDLKSLEVKPISTARTKAERTFWDRMIAFYAYVRDQAGWEDYPHPSGVRVTKADEEKLSRWCIEPLKRTMYAKERKIFVAFAFMNNGPGTDDHLPVGKIRFIPRLAQVER